MSVGGFRDRDPEAGGVVSHFGKKRNRHRICPVARLDHDEADNAREYRTGDIGTGQAVRPMRTLAVFLTIISKRTNFTSSLSLLQQSRGRTLCSASEPKGRGLLPRAWESHPNSRVSPAKKTCFCGENLDKSIDKHWPT